MPEEQWVSVREAVRLTRLSERTLRRRIAEGAIPSRPGATGLEVDVAGRVVPDAPQADAPPDVAADDATTEADVWRLEAELQHCRAMLEAVSGERDYLRQALAAALGTQQLLAERTTEPATGKPRASWWSRLWGRGE